MSQQSKLSGVNKTLVAILMVFILMAMFLSYYFKQEREIENTSLNNVANMFSSQLLIMRSQWFMDNKPNVLLLKLTNRKEMIETANEIDSDNNSERKLAQINIKKVLINKYGWVDDTENSPNPCQRIWAMVMGNNLEFFNMPIGAVLINNNNVGHKCHYNVENGSYFSYNSINGEINVVYQEN